MTYAQYCMHHQSNVFWASARGVDLQSVTHDRAALGTLLPSAIFVGAAPGAHPYSVTHDRCTLGINLQSALFWSSASCADAQSVTHDRWNLGVEVQRRHLRRVRPCATGSMGDTLNRELR